MSARRLDPTTLLRALVDPTRARIMALLDGEPDICVCEFCHALAETQPKISRHLAALRAAELVVDRREGTRVFYALHPRLPAWARSLLGALAHGFADDAALRCARTRLQQMPQRPQRANAA